MNFGEMTLNINREALQHFSSAYDIVLTIVDESRKNKIRGCLLVNWAQNRIIQELSYDQTCHKWKLLSE